MGPIRMVSVGRKSLIVAWGRRALRLFDSLGREGWMMLRRGRNGVGGDIAARKGEGTFADLFDTSSWVYLAWLSGTIIIRTPSCFRIIQSCYKFLLFGINQRCGLVRRI